MPRFAYALVLSLAVTACATADDSVEDDGGAEAATDQAVSGTVVGLYTTSTSLALQNGDIANLELGADGTYVRLRCYHASCSLRVPETDHYDTYTSSSGKTYVRFYSFAWTAGDDRQEKRVVADVYELQRTSTTLKLRKSYSTRWVTLRRTTPKTLCTGDGGTWSASTLCACPGTTGWSDDGYVVWSPGSGGCTMVAGASEADCDDTSGSYTDDDATRIGTFCRCELGQYLTNDGCANL